jgi:hypothetical protein
MKTISAWHKRAVADQHQDGILIEVMESCLLILFTGSGVG